MSTRTDIIRANKKPHLFQNKAYVSEVIQSQFIKWGIISLHLQKIVLCLSSSVKLSICKLKSHCEVAYFKLTAFLSRNVIFCSPQLI